MCAEQTVDIQEQLKTSENRLDQIAHGSATLESPDHDNHDVVGHTSLKDKNNETIGRRFVIGDGSGGSEKGLRQEEKDKRIKRVMDVYAKTALESKTTDTVVAFGQAEEKMKQVKSAESNGAYGVGAILDIALDPKTNKEVLNFVYKGDVALVAYDPTRQFPERRSGEFRTLPNQPDLGGPSHAQLLNIPRNAAQENKAADYDMGHTVFLDDHKLSSHISESLSDDKPPHEFSFDIDQLGGAPFLMMMTDGAGPNRMLGNFKDAGSEIARAPAGQKDAVTRNLQYSRMVHNVMSRLYRNEIDVAEAAKDITEFSRTVAMDTDDITVTIIDLRKPQEKSKQKQDKPSAWDKLTRWTKESGFKDSPEVAAQKMQASINERFAPFAKKNIEDVTDEEAQTWGDEINAFWEANKDNPTALAALDPKETYKLVALLVKGKISSRHHWITQDFKPALANAGWDTKEIGTFIDALKPSWTKRMMEGAKWALSLPGKALRAIKEKGKATWEWMKGLFKKSNTEQETENQVTESGMTREEALAELAELNADLVSIGGPGKKIEDYSETELSQMLSEANSGAGISPAERYKLVVLIVRGKIDTRSAMFNAKGYTDMVTGIVGKDADPTALVDKDAGFSLDILESVSKTLYGRTESSKIDAKGGITKESYAQKVDKIKKMFADIAKDGKWDDWKSLDQDYIAVIAENIRDGKVMDDDDIFNFIPVLLIEGKIPFDINAKSYLSLSKFQEMGWNTQLIIDALNENQYITGVESYKNKLTQIKDMYAKATKGARWDAWKNVDPKIIEKMTEDIQDGTLDTSSGFLLNLLPVLLIEGKIPFNEAAKQLLNSESFKVMGWDAALVISALEEKNKFNIENEAVLEQKGIKGFLNKIAKGFSSFGKLKNFFGEKIKGAKEFFIDKGWESKKQANQKQLDVFLGKMQAMEITTTEEDVRSDDEKKERADKFAAMYLEKAKVSLEDELKKNHTVFADKLKGLQPDSYTLQADELPQLAFMMTEFAVTAETPLKAIFDANKDGLKQAGWDTDLIEEVRKDKFGREPKVTTKTIDFEDVVKNSTKAENSDMLKDWLKIYREGGNLKPEQVLALFVTNKIGFDKGLLDRNTYLKDIKELGIDINDLFAYKEFLGEQHIYDSEQSETKRNLRLLNLKFFKFLQSSAIGSFGLDENGLPSVSAYNEGKRLQGEKAWDPRQWITIHKGDRTATWYVSHLVERTVNVATLGVGTGLYKNLVGALGTLAYAVESAGTNYNSNEEFWQAFEQKNKRTKVVATTMRWAAKLTANETSNGIVKFIREYARGTAAGARADMIIGFLASAGEATVSAARKLMEDSGIDLNNLNPLDMSNGTGGGSFDGDNGQVNITPSEQNAVEGMPRAEMEVPETAETGGTTPPIETNPKPWDTTDANEAGRGSTGYVDRLKDLADTARENMPQPKFPENTGDWWFDRSKAGGALEYIRALDLNSVDTITLPHGSTMLDVATEMGGNTEENLARLMLLNKDYFFTEQNIAGQKFDLFNRSDEFKAAISSVMKAITENNGQIPDGYTVLDNGNTFRDQLFDLMGDVPTGMPVKIR